MEYDDLLLQFSVGPGGGYNVRASSALAGEGTGGFTLPVDRNELAAIAQEMFTAVDARRQRRRAVAARAATPSAPAETAIGAPSLRKLGDALFDALFSTGIRSRYDRCLGTLQHHPDHGLRLRLQMGLHTPELVDLHAVPWEYLRADDGWLALSRRTTIVRHVEVPHAHERPPVAAPLRLLILTAEPQGLPRLDVEAELHHLARVWKAHGRGRVELEILRHATLDALRRALLLRPVHALHFIGHGGLDSTTGRGMLCFEDRFGAPLNVPGPAFAAQLRDVASLRLVVLNACQTACVPTPGPFAGIATALLQVGVPAAIAMQFEISDDAAVAFSQVLYQRLAEGDAVETAVAEGRLAITQREPDSLEWGTPVLFLRAPHGALLPKAATRRVGVPALCAAALIGLASAWLAMRNQAPGRESERTTRTPVPLLTPEATTSPTEVAVMPSEAAPTPPARHRAPAVSNSERTPGITKRATYELEDGALVLVPEWNAHVGAQFTTIYGEEVVQIVLSGAGPSRALVGSGPVTFQTATGARTLDVLSIDWARHKVLATPSVPARR